MVLIGFFKYLLKIVSVEVFWAYTIPKNSLLDANCIEECSKVLSCVGPFSDSLYTPDAYKKSLMLNDRTNQGQGQKTNYFSSS